jgi:Tol biopolymer transport system component
MSKILRPAGGAFSLMMGSALIIFTVAGLGLTAGSQHARSRADRTQSVQKQPGVINAPPRTVGTTGKIVFEKDDQSGPSIWRMNPDGTNQILLANGGSDPSLSRDGTKIAFVVSEHVIWIMNADGTQQIALTTNGLYDQPSVNSDGTKVVFQRPMPILRGDIWIVTSDGSNLRQLTDANCCNILDSYPAFNPDGTKIAFGRYYPFGDGSSGIYTMNADGSDVTQVPGTTGTMVTPPLAPTAVRSFS